MLVGAYQGHLILPVQGKGQSVQNLLAVNSLGQVLHGQHLVADLPEGAEVNVGILTAGGLDIVKLDLFQGTFSGCGLLGLGGIGGEPLDEFLQLLDLLLLLPIGFLHLLDHQLAGLVPEVVISSVELDFGIVDIGDVGADFIQEVAVVGYHDDGILKFDEKLLQPADGV